MSTQTADTRKRRNAPRRVTRRSIRKHETHDRILQSAGTIARREGLKAASVPRVMKGAGLTVGGFYAHFPSKAALDAAIVESTVGSPAPRWASGLEGSNGSEWLQRAVKRYLSKAHRDDPDGCAFPAVLAEVASAPAAVRQALAAALERRAKMFESHAPARRRVTPRERALATMALTIGGLLLARASAGTPVSDEMLEACRKWALPESDAR